VRILTLLFIFFVLTAATNNDGYRFGKKEFTHLNFEVVVVEHKSTKDLVDFAESKKIHTNPRKILKALSVINLEKNVCEIHIIDPDEEYMPAFIGHELAHCIYGRWHK
jgi:hypothetical protein